MQMYSSKFAPRVSYIMFICLYFSPFFSNLFNPIIWTT